MNDNSKDKMADEFETETENALSAQDTDTESMNTLDNGQEEASQEHSESLPDEEAKDICAEADEGRETDPVNEEKELSAPKEPAQSEITSEKTKKVHKKLGKTGKIVLFSILGVALAAAVFLGIYINNIFNNPQSFFDDAPVPSATATVKESLAPADEEAEEEMSEYDKLLSEADKSMMDGILNIALIGIDHAEERDSDEWSGKRAFHADVILILAINFNENTVDMISIPRDTYANIPDVKGIYKINASLDLGGGMYAEGGAGFNKVCETATWMLGGIDVDYYVAVDMNAVKSLGDAIGGVDFDLDVDFNISGRHYKKGIQHMDGQGILDYMRVRKSGNIAASQTGDQNRVNRQKKMLLSVFETMKKKNLLLSVPDIIGAFDGNFYTNLSTSQLAAMAIFGYDLDSENVAMHSMGGSGGKIGEWNFVFTNQKKRVEIIEDVYGVKVDAYSKYTSSAAFEKYMKIADDYLEDRISKVLSEIKAMIGAGDTPPVAPIPPIQPPTVTTPAASPSPSVSQPPESTASAQPTQTENPATPPEPSIAGSVQSLSVVYQSSDKNGLVLLTAGGASAMDMYYQAVNAFNNFKSLKTSQSFDELKNIVTSLASAAGYTKAISWYYPFDEKYNEIYVDFR